MSNGLPPQCPAIERDGNDAQSKHLDADAAIVREFSLMIRAFAPCGGLCTSDHLAKRLGLHGDLSATRVAHRISAREVVVITWQSTTLLPLFQFEPGTMNVRAIVRTVLRELVEVANPWACALWFAQSNPWLDDLAPVELLGSKDRAVLDAARVDRFVQRG